MIQVENLSKKFFLAGNPFYALDNLSFTIKHGNFTCISGLSGSGKTTLLNILGGFLHPTSGNVIFEDMDIHRLSDKKASRFRGGNIGFVYQSFSLIPQLTVFENIRAPLLFEKYGLKNAEKKVKDILEIVGIPEKINEYPFNLSGGQMQRVAIARAVIKNPKILMADEPTGNLDSKTGLGIIKLFKSLNTKEMTILTVSHDQRFIDTADENLVLSLGKLKGKTQKKENKKRIKSIVP